MKIKDFEAESMILNYMLANCIGKQNARKVREIHADLVAQGYPFKEGNLRNTLRLNHSIGFVDSRGVEGGCYVITSKAEAQEIINSLSSRIQGLFDRIDALTKKYL